MWFLVWTVLSLLSTVWALFSFRSWRRRGLLDQEKEKREESAKSTVRTCEERIERILREPMWDIPVDELSDYQRNAIADEKPRIAEFKKEIAEANKALEQMQKEGKFRRLRNKIKKSSKNNFPRIFQ